MGRKTSFGTSMGGVEVSPARRKRQARARAREEAYWARRSSRVESAFACICHRDPETCQADDHDRGGDV